ncbi:MAG: hypothetical protein AAB622_01115 [Patescibacteria group bacterium]
MTELAKKGETSSVLLDPLTETRHLNSDGTKKRRKVDRVKQTANYEQKKAEAEDKLPLTSDDPVLPVVVREIKEREKWWDR